MMLEKTMLMRGFQGHVSLYDVVIDCLYLS
jgi:hypothetical protein